MDDHQTGASAGAPVVVFVAAEVSGHSVQALEPQPVAGWTMVAAVVAAAVGTVAAF